jgi:hypothetical protein
MPSKPVTSPGDQSQAFWRGPNTVLHGTIRERVLTAMRAIGRRGAAEQVGLEAKK